MLCTLLACTIRDIFLYLCDFVLFLLLFLFVCLLYYNITYKCYKGKYNNVKYKRICACIPCYWYYFLRLFHCFGSVLLLTHKYRVPSCHQINQAKITSNHLENAYLRPYVFIVYLTRVPNLFHSMAHTMPYTLSLCSIWCAGRGRVMASGHCSRVNDLFRFTVYHYFYYLFALMLCFFYFFYFFFICSYCCWSEHNNTHA